MNPLVPLARELLSRAVRYALIGVAGANHYAPDGSTVFVTEDHDLFLPSEPDNLVQCWAACEAAGLLLWSQDEPRDRWLAGRVIERRALTRASGENLTVDLTLVMKGFDFETIWKERRLFSIEGVEVSVARLLHIVR